MAETSPTSPITLHLAIGKTLAADGNLDQPTLQLQQRCNFEARPDGAFSGRRVALRPWIYQGTEPRQPDRVILAGSHPSDIVYLRKRQATAFRLVSVHRG